MTFLELAQKNLPNYTVQAIYYEYGYLKAWVKEELFPVTVPWPCKLCNTLINSCDLCEKCGKENDGWYLCDNSGKDLK